jgi:hypothetical protein
LRSRLSDSLKFFQNADGSITIKVPHVMKKGEVDADDHWIDYIFAKDASTDKVIAG